MSTALDTLPARTNGQAIRPMSDFVDVVQHLSELWDLASILHKSRMIPSTIATPEAAVAIILKGRELGIGPMHAFDSISVIQGKPTISPQLMLALIERSGSLEDMTVEEHPESCSITLKRRGRSPQRVTFDRQEANSMGLWGKGNWLKMPGVMLYWRCVAKACRRVFPDIIAGCYTPDEMGASVGEDGEIIDGEVMAEYAPPPEAPRSLPDNGSGHGKTNTYASPEQVDAFRTWLRNFCVKANERWHRVWAERMADGRPVPDDLKDYLHVNQAKNHLMKWCVDAEILDPSIVPEDVKVDQKDKYLAIPYHRSEEDRAAIKAEMSKYSGDQKALKENAIFRKNPDIAPDGWADEQAEMLAQSAAEEAGDDPYIAPQPPAKKPTKKELADQTLAQIRAKAEAAAVPAGSGDAYEGGA